MRVSEEKILFFLQACDYDVEATRQLVLPRDEPAQESLCLPEGWEKIMFDVADDVRCFICKQKGDLLVCEVESCQRVFHVGCTSLETVPSGDWICPAHACAECE
jgi:hypothetical protein